MIPEYNLSNVKEHWNTPFLVRLKDGPQLRSGEVDNYPGPLGITKISQSPLNIVEPRQVGFEAFRLQIFHPLQFPVGPVCNCEGEFGIERKNEGTIVPKVPPSPLLCVE